MIYIAALIRILDNIEVATTELKGSRWSVLHSATASQEAG
jgi:hypothetical protein